ncbi:hypothetical protein SDC9_139197 [bioreactor metagenome]|uniref:Uncharacterized protein n=1 Tax=bioreactor metagenome TaxID=1076179 RepID=A0A645DTZ2_9ZZZZ
MYREVAARIPGILDLSRKGEGKHHIGIRHTYSEIGDIKDTFLKNSIRGVGISTRTVIISGGVDHIQNGLNITDVWQDQLARPAGRDGLQIALPFTDHSRQFKFITGL